MSDSSRRWLDRQHRDPYVRGAHASGYASRAAFKLIEIDRRCGLLRPGMSVVDLGAAPGGFAMVARERVGGHGVVVACDLVPLALPGIRCVQGDAGEATVQQSIASLLPQGRCQVVISDMAPKLSGVRPRDQAAALDLAELAYTIALRLLNPGGAFAVKLFAGEGMEEFVVGIKASFARIRRIKPPASRDASREMYAVCTGLDPSAAVKGRA